MRKRKRNRNRNREIEKEKKLVCRSAFLKDNNNNTNWINQQ